MVGGGLGLERGGTLVGGAAGTERGQEAGPLVGGACLGGVARPGGGVARPGGGGALVDRACRGRPRCVGRRGDSRTSRGRGRGLDLVGGALGLRRCSGH